ncbi:MAG: tRNA pseudouridine(13) synthase TruD, partial [Thermoplasmata archaeon]
MPTDRWRPPAAERNLGMDFYTSAAPGVPGRLKATPEEFRVTEISSYPLPDEAGEFVVLRLVSRDWEQHELAAAIARRLGLPPHALQWAGTKDRRAVSERLFSYRGALPTEPLDLRDVNLLEAYRARDGLVLGHHYGNSFELTVGELGASSAEAISRFARIETELRDLGGFPNFFGPQRFGEVRPITHEVGRWVVRGEVAHAVDVYLTDRPSDGTPGVGDDARRAFSEHRDAVRALREFPREYRFERSLLEHLARGHPPERAFRALSRDLRTLFVHAFQSLIFNRWLGARHSAGLSLEGPVDGDRIVRLGRDGTVRGPEAVPV